jgi:hypothetical protein
MRLGAVVQGLIHTFGHGVWGQITPWVNFTSPSHATEAYQSSGIKWHLLLPQRLKHKVLSRLREYAEEKNPQPEHTLIIDTKGTP